MAVTVESPSFRVLRQVIPVLCGALISVSFGMMLGWPALAYPYLLNTDITPIPITLDETALIAGFLMEGNTIGCLFSTSQLIPSKIAICLCIALQTAGWVTMFYSKNIFWFLASRSSVGFANGYGMGQLKRFIAETCDPDVAQILNRYMPLTMNLGIVIIYSFGAWVSFREMAFYSTLIPIIGLLSFALFPKIDKPVITNRINNVLGSNNLRKDDFGKQLEPIEIYKPYSVIQAIKEKTSRNALLLMFLLVFIQQYSGGPANIVYSQIIFTAVKNPYPKVCSIIYAVCFMVSMFLALTYAKDIARKTNLIISTIACIICVSLVSLYFFLRKDLLEIHEYFSWGPLFLLILFNLFHCFSYGVLPLLLMSERVPKHSLNIASKFWTIHFSMSAVISTKIFQVLFGIFGMSVGYAFFVCVLIVGFVIVIFVEDYTPSTKFEVPSIKINTIENGRVNVAYEETEIDTNTKL